VLLYVGRHPDARLRTVAEEVGITERAAHRILTQLSGEGYLHVTKEGRRNHYRVVPGKRLRHRANLGVPLQPLLDIINPLAEDLNPQE
jgi:DNA-binding IclR family transcriptional regulator